MVIHLVTFFVNFCLVLWQLSNQRADFEQEKEAMEETVRGLARELRLHQLVIDAYIPDQYQQLIHSHSTWNEDTGEWHLVGPFINTSLPHVTLTLSEVWPMLGTTYRDLQHLLTNRYYLIDYCIPGFIPCCRNQNGTPEWPTSPTTLVGSEFTLSLASSLSQR